MSAEAGVQREPSRPAIERLDSLTSLRWVAAVTVFAVHFDAIAGVLPGLHLQLLQSTATPVLDSGYAAVCFFFVLSGFVLTLAQLKRRVRMPGGRFLRDRVARIYPMHIATSLMAAVILSGATIATAVPALLAVQPWIPRQRYVYALNVPSWSLGVEMFFYVCFPFLLPRLEAIKQRRAALAVLVATTIVLGFVPGLLSGPNANLWVLTFPPARIPEFMIGILLALEINEGHWRNIPQLPAYALFVIVVCLDQHLPVGFQFAAAAVIPVILVVAATAGADLRGTRTALHWRWWIRLGEWTFAFYVVHNLVLIRFAQLGHSHRWSSSPVVPLLLAGALLLACIGAAGLLHVFLEVPGQKVVMGRKPFERREAPVSQTPP